MRSASAPSLMDDVEFGAELEKLELTTPPAASSHSGWDDLDDGLVTDVVTDDADSAEWVPRPTTFAERQGTKDLEAGALPALGLARRVLLAGGFLLMIGVGAGAAALMFRDRLALIFH